MSDSGKQKKPSSGKSNKYGKAVKPCAMSAPGAKDLVVMVGDWASAPLDGFIVHVKTQKSKRDETTAAGGMVAFTRLDAGPATVSVALSLRQKAVYLPIEKDVTITKGQKIEEVLKLKTIALDVSPKITVARAQGIFDPVTRRTDPLALELQLQHGNPDALNHVEAVFTRGHDSLEVYSDPACNNAVVFANNRAKLLLADFSGNRKVTLWARNAADTPADVKFSVARTAVPKPAKKSDPVPPQGVPGPEATRQLTFATPDFTPSFKPQPRGGPPYTIQFTLGDADKIVSTAKVAIEDKDGAEVAVLAALDFSRDARVDLHVKNWDGRAARDRAPFKARLTAKDRFNRTRTAEQPVKLAPLPSHLRLSFKDPDGIARALPEGLDVDLVFEDASTERVKIAKDGALVAVDGEPGLPLDEDKKSFTIRVPKSEQYLVCEARGAAKPVAATLKAKAAFIALTDGSRGFLLPGVDWTLAESVWAVTDDGGAWVALTSHFKIGDKPIGTDVKPVQLSLDPRWQFARFTYHDRFRGGAEQVSALPLLVEGYAEPPGKVIAKGALITHSNWTIGADAEKAVQCLPWIVKARDSTKVKPDKLSELRFHSADHSFIESPADPSKPRLLAVGEKNEPNAARLRFYDLPKEWRSRGWYVRKTATGKDHTGKFWAALADFLGTKALPLVFSLDDIVLYTSLPGKKLEPLAALDEKQPVAVFHHTFAKGTEADLSNEGLYLGVDKPICQGAQTIDDLRWPASKPEVLARAGVDGRRENYVYRYPDWTRAVIAESNVFDVFAERSAPDDDAQLDRMVGARAAVAFQDVTAAMDGVRPPGSRAKGKHPPIPESEISPRPKVVQKPFLSLQALAEFEVPVSGKRLDYPTLGAKGTRSAVATDFGVRYGRDPTKAEEWKTPSTSNRTIGRFDCALFRCCAVEGKDGSVEKAIQLGYYRLAPSFDNTTTHDDKTKQQTWVETAITGLTRRWNGPDGSYNPGRARVEARDPAKRKLVAETLRFFQKVPLAKACFNVQVKGKVKGARDYMNTVKGVTQSQDGKEKPDSNGRFTAAHEMGHGGGLLDDYSEVAKHASYGQPSALMLVPGDPYIYDDVDGAESMMKANKEVRARHFWQVAEWIRAQLTEELDVQVVHGQNAPYFLPHHAQNRKVGAKGLRSFLTYPWTATLDVAHGAGKARYDAYLWALGDDVYSERLLPLRSEDQSGKSYDGILVIAVAMCLNFDTLVDHDLIQNAAGKLVATVRKKFGFRVHAQLEAGGRKFERCLVHVSPRIVVGTHAGDASYDKKLGLDPTLKAEPWEADTVYEIGDIVLPTSGGDTWVYTCTADNCDPVEEGSGPVEPAWPTVSNGKVIDLALEWTAEKKSVVRKSHYEDVIRKKLEHYPVHAVVEVGASTSGIDTPLAALPRIRIATQQIEVFKEMSALATAVHATELANWGARNKEWDDLLAARKAKKIEGDAAVVLKNQKFAILDPLERNIQAALAAYQLARRNALPDEAQRLQEVRNQHGPYTTANNEFLTAQTAAATRITEYNDLTTKANKAGNDVKALKVAEKVVAVLGKVKEMADLLFTTDVAPLTDQDFEDLQREIPLCTTEAAQRYATRDSVVGCITSNQPAAVVVQGALGLLSEWTPAKKVASVAEQFLAIATKIHDWAAAGADDAGKKSRADDARLPIAKLLRTATDARAAAITAQKLQVQGGWSTANYGDAYIVSQLEKVCAPRIGAAVRDEYLTSAPATMEEQVAAQVAAFLGLEPADGSTVGYLELAKSVADAGKVPVVRIAKQDIPDAPPMGNPPHLAPPEPVVPVVIRSLQDQIAEMLPKLKPQILAPLPPIPI